MTFESHSTCVSSTDPWLLALYGCDGAHEEVGLGRELVQPALASLSLCHPVIRNSEDKGRKGFTQQFISLLLMRDGQGHNNVSQLDLAISELCWQRISIGLVPALEQTLRARCYELHVENTCRVSPSLLILGDFWVNMGQNSAHHPWSG